MASDSTTLVNNCLSHLQALNIEFDYEPNLEHVALKLESQAFDLLLLTLTSENISRVKHIIQKLRTQLADEYLPIIGLCAFTDSSLKQGLQESGITDFLKSDVDRFDLSLRISSLLENRRLDKLLEAKDTNTDIDYTNTALIEANAHLAHLNQQLDNSCDEVFKRFARVTEYRDDSTGKHIERVGILSAKIAAYLDMSSSFVYDISKAAGLHDFGKVAIPDSILLKPGKLTKKEYKIMQTHCEVGAELLAGTNFELLNLAKEIALSHHEKLDGSGYPYHLMDEEIPLEGKIVAVADVFDALCHKRPYKEAWTETEAIELLQGRRGTHFDVQVIDALSAILKQKNVQQTLAA